MFLFCFATTPRDVIRAHMFFWPPYLKGYESLVLLASRTSPFFKNFPRISSPFFSFFLLWGSLAFPPAWLFFFFCRGPNESALVHLAPSARLRRAPWCRRSSSPPQRWWPLARRVGRHRRPPARWARDARRGREKWWAAKFFVFSSGEVRVFCLLVSVELGKWKQMVRQPWALGPPRSCRDRPKKTSKFG